MPDSLKFSIPSSYDEIFVIGFRIDPDREKPHFFTIFFMGDNDCPLTTDNYIVIFNDLDFLFITLKLANPETYEKLDKSEIETVDIAKLLYLISTEQIDDSATIVDSINIIIDLLKAINLSFPNNYKSKLFQVADYFTFNKDITAFFNTNDISRKEFIDIILWCIGAIVSKSRFLTN